MKKRKHLYPEMRYFVYENDSVKSAFPGVVVDSANHLLLLFYVIFALVKMVFFNLPLGFMEINWGLMAIAVRFIGEGSVRNIEDPQIKYIATKMVNEIELELMGLYGLIGVVLAYYQMLYLMWIILFVMVLSVVCIVYWIGHCILWEKYSQNASKKSNIGCALIGVSSVATFSSIGSVTRITMKDETARMMIMEVSMLCLATIWIVVPIYPITFMAMKLYYYYRYLRFQ